MTLAADGVEAITRLREECPDLVLCDLTMPNMDGFALARRLRRMPECGHVRLVALTGLGDEASYLKTWAAGFDAHLVKPISFEKLNALAERFLLGTTPPPPAPRRSEA